MEEIATAIVTALSTGAAFVAKETTSEIVKDAYTNLKSWLQSHYPNVSIGELERQPTSKARQEVVREDLESEDVLKDSELIKLAGTIVELVKKETRDTAATIGVDLGE